MIDLTGKVALVTGSSRGIGRACALRLAEAGADVVVNYVTSQAAGMEVAESIRALGRRAAVVRADVSEQEDVAGMISFIQESWRRNCPWYIQRSHSQYLSQAQTRLSPGMSFFGASRNVNHR